MAIKIVFLDCDGTLTTVKSSWQYLHERLDLWDANADEYQRLFHAGVIDYEEFCRRDAALWKGRSVEEVKSIISEIPYNDGVEETLRKLTDRGIETVIISTGLRLLVEKVREELAVSFALANELMAVDGVLTGDIRINVTHGHKGLWVKKILAERGLSMKEAAAVGDGEGDLEMFEEVGLAVGYRLSEKILPYVSHAFHDGSFLRILEVIEGDR